MFDHENLDAEWINEFENIDTSYNKFYKESVDFLRVTYVYIGKNDSIDHVKREKMILRPHNVLPYNVLMGLIHTQKKGRPHKFECIVKYNIAIEPSDVKYIFTEKTHNQYIHETTKIDTVSFEDTISMFQDLNEIFIFFRDTSGESSGHSKTVKLRSKISSRHKKTMKTNG
jgi:hypothetical protein